uniref:Putative zinc transporter protein DDB_G0283629 n=1 Tax=Lygus hesperus TaxID=30085 RepID=A0A0A9X1H9_LYGHE
MNVRAALIHVLGDCLQAVGVVIAAVIMYIGNQYHYRTASSAHSYYNLADPLLSLLFGVITICTTKSLICEVLGILMERAPDSTMYERAVKVLYNATHVSGVEDVHI